MELLGLMEKYLPPGHPKHHIPPVGGVGSYITSPDPNPLISPRPFTMPLPNPLPTAGDYARTLSTRDYGPGGEVRTPPGVRDAIARSRRSVGPGGLARDPFAPSPMEAAFSRSGLNLPPAPNDPDSPNRSHSVFDVVKAPEQQQPIASRYQDTYDRLDSRISDLGTRMDGSEDQEQVGNMALQQQRLQGTRDYYARTEQEGDRLYAGMQAKVAAAGGDTGVLRPHELDYWNRRELSKTDPTVFSSTPSAAAAGAIAQGSQLRQAEMARQLPSPASVTPSSSPFAQQPQPQPSSLRQGMLTHQAPMTPQQSPMSVGVPSTSVAPQQPSQQQSTSSPPPRGTEGAYGQTRTTTPRIPSTITIPHGNPAYLANMGPKNSATGMQAIYDDATKAMSPGRQVQPMFDARSYNYQMPTGAYGQTGSFGQQTGTWRNQFGNTIASPSNPRGLGRQQNMPLQPLPPLPDQNTTTRSGAPARMGVNQFSRANRPRGTTF